jgi:hypothetical protein
MENLAKQYNLSLAQTQAAVEALLPAFSLGLKRQAAEPAQMPNLFSMLGGAAPGTIYDNPFAAFTPQAAQQGNEVLGTLFGSKDVSRAVAEQAAAMTGIGSQVLTAMLPVIASILMAGLGKTAAAQPQLQDIFGQMASGAKTPAEIFAGMWGQPPPAASPRVEPNQNGGGLLGALLGSLLQQGVQQTAPPPRQSAEPAENPYGALFAEMFETGRKVQETQADAFRKIFDAFIPPGESKNK